MRCANCGEEKTPLARGLGVCLDCIRGRFEEVRSRVEDAHRTSRIAFNLPTHPPRDPDGIPCNICVNGCVIGEGRVGYCGVRANREGRLVGGGPMEGNLSWYYDPLPTNCVADWVCPGGTGAGYPEYSYCKGPEYGYKNLAVFYHGCSFNCLFCQNWHYRRGIFRGDRITSSRLADKVDGDVSCICFFGGDPTPFLPHAIHTSHLAMERTKGRILRVCWETNGSMNPSLLDKVFELSLKSGGCVKFDLKAWSEEVNIALCGVTNKRTLKNFSSIARRFRERPEPPPVVASTLLVPGYIDDEEVKGIARFIASLDEDIPYSLLAFCPHFYMDDLPTTSKEMAERCFNVARGEGLRRVRIGNVHLLR